MAFAAGSYHSVRYIPEATFNTDPSYSGVTELRHTSCSLVLTKDSFRSNELRDDRQISCFRHGQRRVGGDMGIEFSAGEFDSVLELALFNKWAGTGTKLLVAGVTPYSFQIERAFTDIDKYGKFTGCMVNTFSLNIPANGLVTGSVGWVGASARYSATPLVSDVSITASQVYCPFDSFSGVLMEGGTTLATVTSMDFSINNGLEAAFVIGQDYAPQITPGMSDITGTLSAYFSDITLLNKFINETESSLLVKLGSSPFYKITFPNIKYSGGDNPASGPGPIMLNLPFQALYESGTSKNITIERSIALVQPHA